MDNTSKSIIILSAVVIILMGSMYGFSEDVIEIPSDKTLQTGTTLGLLIANLLVALLIYYQMKQSKNQFIGLNRPWLHLRLVKTTVPSHTSMGTDYTTSYPLILENSGNLTAENIKITTNNDYLNKIIIRNRHSSVIDFKEFFPNQKTPLLETVYEASHDGTDIIPITLSYEFNKKPFMKDYYLYQVPNRDPQLTDINPMDILL